MKQPANSYVSNRVLKLNVGFLLTAGLGHSRDSEFDAPAVRVSDDLQLNYIRGPMRLSRTKEGILLQAHFQVGYEAECYRCLEDVSRDVTLDLEELYAYPNPFSSEFSVSETGILDLAPLLRAEVLISSSQRVLCRPDCKGLCVECGTNLNYGTCDCALEDIDPRLAGLKNLLK